MKKIKNILKAVRATFASGIYKVFGLSLFLNFLALDYIILSQATTLRVLFNQNTGFYVWSVIILSIITAVLFAIAVAMTVKIFEQKRAGKSSAVAGSGAGTFFGALASGCPVCGAWLLPLFGIAGSLAAFPLQGLDIKILAILMLIFAIYQSTNSVLGICSEKEAKKNLIFSAVAIILFILALFILTNLPNSMKVQFQKSGIKAPTEQELNLKADLKNLYNQVNPKEGYELKVNYGNIGYQLVQGGAIDFEQFKAVYDRAGQPLTEEQLKIFSKEGLNKKIKIDRKNSYFLLNLFWAFGLANENKILTEGEIVKYGDGQVGNFASTGGWTIASKPLEEFMAKLKLAPLNDEQQKLLEKVASSVYRPCCGNSTAFPDCNHGMALLGVLELLASQGATEEELYEASKYFSAFWFPNQMMDVATYFLLVEKQNFDQVDAKTAVSERFFSGRGWSGLKAWLEQNLGGGQTEAPAGGGGGCGVESGAPAQAQSVTAPQIKPAGGGGCGV